MWWLYIIFCSLCKTGFVCSVEYSTVDRNYVSEYYDLFLLNPYPAVLTYNESLIELGDLCPKYELFGSFEPHHYKAVTILSEKYEDAGYGDALVDYARMCLQDGSVNPKVWYSALWRTQLQRPEDWIIPGPFYSFPTHFFCEELLQQNTTGCRLLDENFGKDNGAENAVWYYREDTVLNAHHWFWHMFWPFRVSMPADRRRGELFTFFHHDLLARYETERIANCLKPNMPLDLKLSSVIEQGYNPHLKDGISTEEWAVRSPYQQIYTDISDIDLLKDFTYAKLRAVELMELGLELTINGSHWFPFPYNMDQINVIGQLIEASTDSINPDLYGLWGVHNLGHVVLAFLTANFTQPPFGVMYDITVAIRDPIFWRWHLWLDDYFAEYKSKYLKPYRLYEGENSLIYPGIILTSVKIIPQAYHSRRSPNYLFTYWNTTRMFLDNGLDFRDPDPDEVDGTVPPPINVTVCQKHLDHEEFVYHIQIENERQVHVPATIRIFLSPRYKSVENKKRYTMSEQRRAFFTMDAFSVELKPGRNFLTRRSVDSTLTAPWPKSIEEIQRSITANNTRETKCSCGFPHHLLLPKGTEEGMPFDLFVIVTQDIIDTKAPSNNTEHQCIPSHIHCGIQGAAYPDSKPMGYPFDRRPFDVPYYYTDSEGEVQVKPVPVENLEEYVHFIPNSFTTQIVITHRNVQHGYPHTQPLKEIKYSASDQYEFY